MSFFNYFTDAEREGARKATAFKNRVFAWIHPTLVRLHIHPDVLSYVGLALLVGVIIWFKAHPFRTVALLVLYVMIDGLDGSYARYLNRPTQAGAFTDIVVDQLGMVVVALGFIQYGLVDGMVGAYYIMIYLVMITFSVIQNTLAIPMQYIFRSKYILYGMYVLWAFTGINLAPGLIPLFCLIMTWSVIQSYRRLKRGFSWRYDLPRLLHLEQKLRAEGQRPPHFWPVLTVGIPALTGLLMLILGAWPQMMAMVERPDLRAAWLSRPLPLPDKTERPRAVAAAENGWYVSTYNRRTGFVQVYYFTEPDLKPAGQFRIPWAVHPDHGACAEGAHLYLTDRLSRRLYDINLPESFSRGIAVLDRSFATTLSAPVGCALVSYRGRPAMLISEYMNNYQTILVDAEKAFAAGTAVDAHLRWYRNAGFARGLAAQGSQVVEMNSSFRFDIIYLLDLGPILRDKYLRSGIIATLAAPRWHCRDLALAGNTLALVDGRRSLLYTTSLPPSPPSEEKLSP